LIDQARLKRLAPKAALVGRVLTSKTVLAIAALTLVVFSWRQGNAVPEDLDPLRVVPDTHKLVFENQFVRVLEVNVPPGKLEPWHKHANRVVVDLNDSATRSTERGGQPKESTRKAGSVRWVDATVHQVENIGKTPLHSYSIELE
jgi:predicted metal-dependent enzyme (double-stranded beta helix superfamily)